MKSSKEPSGKRKKSVSYRVSKKLNAYSDTVLFKEKLERANKRLSASPLR
jgi:hypothetical protein